jgi:2-polyprenyl-3-methyl-5-hydroxy-6-metoxy-1,4-benzoquinol methylase
MEEIATIERYKKRGRILDVGCNLGMLLRLAKARGWETVGVEPSPSLAPLAAMHGFPVHNCFLHEVPDSEEHSFDVVALSDVFEHICEPIDMLKDAARFLKEDGILYVKVPNARWNLFKQGVLALAGRKPAMGIWDSCEHVVHYTSETLRSMLRRGRFEALKVTTAKPVQVPVWHEYVGRYYTYPSPWVLDWKRHLGRSLFYYLALAENVLRLGSLGYFSPCVVAVAAKKR